MKGRKISNCRLYSIVRNAGKFAMGRVAFVISWSTVVLLMSACGVQAQQADPAPAREPIELTLPPALYAVPGVPVGFYYGNIVRPLDLNGLVFSVTCRIGKDDGKSWLIDAADQDVGEHPLAVAVKDKNGLVLAEAKTVLRVVPRNAGKERKVRILIVGDSLTGNGGGYPFLMKQLFSKPDNPECIMLGTRNSPELPSVRTEGYPGWKWEDFIKRYEPNPDPKNKKVSSPFVFAGADGAPGLDVARYVREQCDGKAPDVVTFLLGINDASRLYSSTEAGQNREKLDQGINGILEGAENLLKAFRAAMPETALAVGIIPPSNGRDAAFAANFQGTRTVVAWKRIQHRTAQRMIERFKGREKENIFLVPTELFLDPESGFPDNNAVHPNMTGHGQLGATFYSWMKWHLVQEGK
ncbi:MAG: GDSL-type esterase/lipase family protein [Victivallales bacterium]|jgi:lysophospholipase L1-like esterase